MHEVRLCRKEPSYVALAQISESLQNAVIVSEDSAFWDHEGIDWIELRKSFETNIEKGRFARGGSTITQQLAKNVYLSPEKSVLRKIKEAVIATRIERQYKKKLILEKYLNVVEFDKNIYGVKKAAQHYFQTTPRSLTIAQSAWLAFLLPNPPKYSISFHRNKLTPFAFKQMSEIINRLGRFKKISESDRAAALDEARSMFGGLSGESTELYEELEEDGESTEVPNIPPTPPPQVEEPVDSNVDSVGEPATDPIDEELSNSSNDP
jgi:monofunctional biosynthetic peptidoglycan transglycosylase